MGALKTTPLTGYEIELGAKMTPRAGWNTALYYPEGIIAEHRPYALGLFGFRPLLLREAARGGKGGRAGARHAVCAPGR